MLAATHDRDRDASGPSGFCRWTSAANSRNADASACKHVEKWKKARHEPAVSLKLDRCDMNRSTSAAVGRLYYKQRARFRLQAAVHSRCDKHAFAIVLYHQGKVSN